MVLPRRQTLFAKGRQWDWELGWFVETPVSASNIICTFHFHTWADFRSLEGLEDTRRREHLSQEG